jgi:parallel beta-helix repeat protein
MKTICCKFLQRTREENMFAFWKAAAGSLLGGLVLCVGATAFAEELRVDCAAGESINAALNVAGPGSKIIVSGHCKEAVFIKPDKFAVTLDGQGTATVEGPPADTIPMGPDAFTFFVMGRMIKIEGFTITGGFHAVHLSGPSTVEVVNNTIRDSGGAIHLDKGSMGLIYGNVIENNTTFGINLIENSYARIGFRIPPQPEFQPNIIRNNDGNGIVVGRWSSAWIMGNEISGNTGTGVLVDRGSIADVAANDISGNGRNGITVMRNSGVSFHSEGTERPESGNDSTLPNTGYGVACDLDGFIEGRMAGLAGTEANSTVTGGCEARLTD